MGFHFPIQSEEAQVIYHGSIPLKLVQLLTSDLKVTVIPLASIFCLCTDVSGDDAGISLTGFRKD